MSSRDGRTPRRSGGNCGFHLSREECESSILLVSGNISSHQIIVGWDIVRLKRSDSDTEGDREQVIWGKYLT